jgi:hypothetical protein
MRNTFGRDKGAAMREVIRRFLALLATVVLATFVAACAQRTALAPSPVPTAPVGAQTPTVTEAEITTESLTYGLPTVSLQEGLSKMQRRVSLPDPLVAGTPIAVMISHGPKGANSLWIQYSRGTFLQIEPRHPGQGPGVFASNYVGLSMRHPDGSPYIRTERIAGRETVIATAGELVAGKMPAQTIRDSFVSWIENGYVYVLQPRTHEATLSVLLEVAASTP